MLRKAILGLLMLIGACVADRCVLFAQEVHGAARVAALRGSPARADSVAVDSAAAVVLADAYTPHREAAWCIDRWHLERGHGDTWVPVVDAVYFAAWGDSLHVARPSCFNLHTHPPEFPRPSWRDIGLAIFGNNDPFLVIQYGPHQFSGWVTTRILLHRR